MFEVNLVAIVAEELKNSFWECLDRFLMVRHGIGMRSETGMSRSPLYVLECDSSPGPLDLLLKGK